MSVNRRSKYYSGIREDIPMLRSIESSTAQDFNDLLTGLVTGLNSPFLCRGFDVVIPGSSIQATSLTINVSDSAVLVPTASEPGTILTVPAGTTAEILSNTNGKVIGSFQNGVPNYISLDYRRVTDQASLDSTSGWIPSENIEVQRTVPVASVLDYRFVISTSSFGSLLPLYIVGVDSNGFVTYITKATTGLFRLGRGGSNPLPTYNYNYDNLINPQTGTIEEWINTDPVVSNPMSVVPGDDPNAFQYGDWAIKNMKDWMDAVMTRFKQITGSNYWYVDTAFSPNPPGSFNLFDVWWDSGAGSVITSAGNLSFNIILEATQPTQGIWQSNLTDPNILPGDSYVKGVTSGATGNLQSFVSDRLIVNTVSGTFIIDEPLEDRRLYRPLLSLWQLNDDFDDGTDRFGRVTRIPLNSNSWLQGASWSFNGKVITVTTTTPHGFSSGDVVELAGLVCTTYAPNGSAYIKSVPTTTSFVITAARVPTGVPTFGSVSNVRLDNNTIDPYIPNFPVTNWSALGSTLTITAPNHTFLAPLVQTGTTTNTSDTITGLSDTSVMSRGMDVSGAGIPSGSYILEILSGSSVQISNQASASATVPITFSSIINLKGLASTVPADEPILNDRLVIDNVLTNGDIVLTMSSGVAGSFAASNVAFLNPDYLEFLLTITGATPSIYNLTDTVARAFSPIEMMYIIGPSGLPVEGTASGPIQFDGVVTVSTVADPVMVQEIQNVGPDIQVTTFVPNTEVTGGPKSVTIYGNPSLSPFIRTYDNVTVSVIDNMNFLISGADLPVASAYINGGSDNTFLNFPNNPYPGPIAWSADIFIKGIIGDKWFKIPQTATADGTSTANQFNTNGQTGTAFLQDKEVAYIVLERNLPVSSGQNFTCNAGGPIVGSSPPLDVHGVVLQPGDFVKFTSDPETRWFEILNVSGNTINLVSDYTGLTPNAAQRPAATGPIVYCKGTYDVVHVEPHWLVTNSPDTYWIAVRRDNGAAGGKVYFRGMELTSGETINIGGATTNNLLIYTGAGNDAATSPNYEHIDPSGDWSFSETLTVQDVDANTRSITFDAAPQLGFSDKDQLRLVIGPSTYNFTIDYPLTSRTVIVKEDVAPVVALQTMTYFRVDYAIQESDNLTLAIRKEDRELAKVNTNLSKPIYDENVYCQQINMNGAGTVKSGDFIYLGTYPTNITALAWVLNGSANVSETIEGSAVTMPGGAFGANSILAHIYFGSFTDGSNVNQLGAQVGTRTINNPADPAFTAPSIPGDLSSGTEIVLPPNRRTQVVSGSDYTVWPSESVYQASTDPAKAGEELLVVINDTLRQAELDYRESFGGPKSKIRIGRTTPTNTRMRFRALSAVGSVIASTSGAVSLQVAYNAGNAITTSIGLPVVIVASDFATGGQSLQTTGNITIDGRNGGNVINGLMGPLTPNADQAFLIGKETNKPLESWTALEAIKTQVGWAGTAWFQKTAAQVTTTATPTIVNASDIVVADQKVCRVMMTVVGRESTNAGYASYRIEAAFFRNGGNVTLIGSPVSEIIAQQGTGSTTSFVFGVTNPDTIQGVVIGNVGETWYFASTIEYQIVNTSA